MPAHCKFRSSTCAQCKLPYCPMEPPPDELPPVPTATQRIAAGIAMLERVSKRRWEPQTEVTTP